MSDDTRTVEVEVPADWYGLSAVIVVRGHDDNNRVMYKRGTMNGPDEVLQMGMLRWAEKNLENAWRARGCEK